MKSFSFHGFTRGTVSGALMLASLAGCLERGRGAGQSAGQPSTTPDAAVTTTSSAVVTMPATWVNLWGSWPLTRYDHAAAYDSDRRIMVVYGGLAGATGPFYSEVWEFDGARGSFVQRTPGGDPTGNRSGHAMAYDPVAKKTFMFGGWSGGAIYVAGQWEWDGPTASWKQRTTTSVEPTPRRGHTMVYDPDRKKIVMFGGLDENGVRLNEVWEWDGAAGSWARRTTSGTPPAPRYGHTAAYDLARKKMIIRQGAVSSTTGVDETWELDSATGAWTQLVTPTTAALRPTYYSYLGYERIAYDSARSKTVLYEYGITTPTLVYELDPTIDAPSMKPAWVSIMTTRPDSNDYPPSVFSTFLYDPDRARLVLFAGQNQDRELWDYDGSSASWLNRSVARPSSGPIQRTDPMLAFDSKRGKLMVFGGRGNVDGINKQDLWEWNGATSTFALKSQFAAELPPARYAGGMVYDSKRDRLLLFGGTGAATYNDLWEWAPDTQVWSRITVSGTLPSARYNFRLFYDGPRDKVVMVGSSSYLYNEVWEWDPAANRWTSRMPTIPTDLLYRSNADVALDPDRSKLVMFGGAYSVYKNDLWEYDLVAGGDWVQRVIPAAAAIPPERNQHAMTYDPTRRVVLLFGGYGADGRAKDDSWEWDGTNGVWTETTPIGVRPLPRYNHNMRFDTTRATAYVFGGVATGENIYGYQELWEYSPNAALRPNGAACSAATAARCQSGNCVDGVCCSTASCPGTCRACNVPGPSLGTCADVAPGQPDDGCANDQACNAEHQCKTRNGQGCGAFADCGSGFCVDGVCCDTACTDTCKTCFLTGRRGTCSNLPSGDEDPNAAPACASSLDQGRFCDGNGVCTNAKKATGKPCTASGQCLSNYCIDGFCCNTACNGVCQTCAKATAQGTCSPVTIGLQDPSATMPCDQPMQYCNGGSVCMSNKKPNGGICTAATDCGSNFCVDGYCCNSGCTGSCQACNVTGNLGSCVNVTPGSADPNSGCTLPQSCDSTATCQSGLKANGATCTVGTQCISTFCVDGVCCDGGCTATCRTCGNPEGKCQLLPPGSADTFPMDACKAPNYCAAGGECTTGRKPNGATCGLNNECGSNLCIDGTCCETPCYGSCQTCKNSSGTCVNTPDGTDPRGNCVGEANCGGTCNGQGTCRFPAQGLKCREAGCQSDGFIGGAGACDGAGRCKFDTTTDCKGFICDIATGACLTDCASDPMCVARSYCQQSQCPVALPDGEVCQRDRQCQNGHCARANPADANGVCCNRACDACGSCNMPGKVGICIPAPAGSDDVRCINSASDPTGKCGGKCDGQWACQFPAALTPCGMCKACDGSGKCNQAPEDDTACGDIDCDGLDTSCRNYNDIKVKRCAALGMCKTANMTATCTDFMMSCQDDGGSGADTGTTDGPGTDAPAKGGGGGGCCAVAGTSPRAGLPSLALMLGLAVVAGARRRRRR